MKLKPGQKVIVTTAYKGTSFAIGEAVIYIKTVKRDKNKIHLFVRPPYEEYALKKGEFKKIKKTAD